MECDNQQLAASQFKINPASNGEDRFSPKKQMNVTQDLECNLIINYLPQNIDEEALRVSKSMVTSYYVIYSEIE